MFRIALRVLRSDVTRNGCTKGLWVVPEVYYLHPILGRIELV